MGKTFKNFSKTTMPKGAFSRAIFLWQRSIVTETLAKYLRSHTATKSLKENLSKNLCNRILSHNLCCSVHTNDDKSAKITRAKHTCSCKLACVNAYFVGFDLCHTFYNASRQKKALGSGFSHIYGYV